MIEKGRLNVQTAFFQKVTYLVAEAVEAASA